MKEKGEDKEREKGQYPAPAGITAGRALVVAFGGQEKPHPDGAAGFLHILPEKPHHRI